MKSRRQRAGGGRRKIASACGEFCRTEAAPHPVSRRAGFTLVEVLLATVISVMVFFAMGTVLNRSFKLWMDAMANWTLAQHAQVARLRLLTGGFGPGTGLLSSSNVTAGVSGMENYVQYYPLGTNGAFCCYGWISVAAGKNIRLKSGSSEWALGQNVAASNYVSNVGVYSFVSSVSGTIVQVTYRMSLSRMGKEFSQPCTVKAFLVNQ